ncbi:MAG TPA: 3'-5' exonuclease [Telmatospirillum sp.]|nr:3'-5' exonuclease [Telmatospirillum sp.]
MSDPSSARAELQQIAIPSVSAVGSCSVLAIDFETATASRASPCAVGLCWLDEGAVIGRAYRLIRPPGNDFAPFNIAFHGIGPGDVANAPEFPVLWEELLPHLPGALLLAHNASFDISVLRRTLDIYGLPWPDLSYFCTMLGARRVWPDLANHKLNTVARHLGFSFRHHHAGEDAEACGRIAVGQMAAVGVKDPMMLAPAIGMQLGRLHRNG